MEIPFSEADHDFHRQMRDQGEMRRQMDQHAQGRIVNLADPTDLKAHMMEAHGYYDDDFWRNSHDQDHPALQDGSDTDRPLSHREVRSLHDWEHGRIRNDHPDYDGGLPGQFMGDSHFHTAGKMARRIAKAPLNNNTDSESGKHKHRTTDYCTKCGSDIYLIDNLWVHDDDSGAGLPHQAIPADHEVDGSGKTYLGKEAAAEPNQKGLYRHEVKAQDIKAGDYLHANGKIRVHTDALTRGTQVHVAWKQKGSKAPGITSFTADTPMSVWRRQPPRTTEASRKTAAEEKPELHKALDAILDSGAQSQGHDTFSDWMRHDNHTKAMQDLTERYSDGPHHPLNPGHFGFEDLDEDGDQKGDPYYEVKDPSGSGWRARDYSGGYVHIGHEATDRILGQADADHDVIDAHMPGYEGGFDKPAQKPPTYGHESLHQDLHDWVHGAPADPRYPDDVNESTGRQWTPATELEGEYGEPRIRRWQKQKGYKRMASKLAYGETKAPEQVDTLRDADCPVCGSTDSTDGDTCQICGYVAPPAMFRDPDLEKAHLIDLRADPATGAPNDTDPMIGDPNAPVDPMALDENGDLPRDDSGQVTPEVQALGDAPMDPEQLDENGNPVDVDLGAAQGRVPQGGEMFQKGPNAPTPMDPMDPATEETMEDEEDAEEGVPTAADGQQMAPEAQDPGEAGFPGDGIPDLMCPSCGFQSDAASPLATSTDAQAPNANPDGMQVGDVCPECQQAQLVSVGEMEQMQAAEQMGPGVPPI